MTRKRRDTKQLTVPVAQAHTHRMMAIAHWQQVRREWVNLDLLLSHEPMVSLESTARRCAQTYPRLTNPCGIVGCLAGWLWTCRPYQLWCDKHELNLASTVNLAAWLGVLSSPDTARGFWGGRKFASTLSPHAEATGRLRDLVSCSVYDRPATVSCALTL